MTMEQLPTVAGGIIGVLLFTCFVKIATTLSILRYGIGLHDSAFGVVILAVAFSLTMFVMEPTLKKIGGVDKLFWQSTDMPPANLGEELRPFLLRHADQKLTDRLVQLTASFQPHQQEENPNSKGGADTIENVDQKEATSVYLLSSSFLLTELRSAFYVGLVILIPFLVIDLLVTNILMSLGVTQMPHAVAALPLKLLVFFILDGWALVTEKIVSGYTV